MARTKLKWSSLLRLTELDFRPDFPTELSVLDEVMAVISWLTACTNQDRRLLRCTPQGALLTGNAWDLMTIIGNSELYPEPAGSANAFATVGNKGVLIATSTEIVKVVLHRTDGAAGETIYLPANCLYFFPYSIYDIYAYTVPADTGTASYVGVTYYK